MHMDPIGNKPIGFYGLSMVYTMSLFLDVIHILKLSLSEIIFIYLNDEFYNIYIMSIHFHLFQCCTKALYICNLLTLFYRINLSIYLSIYCINVYINCILTHINQMVFC